MKCFVSILSCASRFVGEMLRVHFEYLVLNVCVCVCVLVFMFMNVILKNSEQEICGISHLIVV